MYKYKITLEYDGTGYRGWQTQKNARSVQGTLLESAKKLLGSNLEIQGAGRTDAGVHALAQVAHITTIKSIKPQRIMEELNDLLPSSINIWKIEEVTLDFHARRDAKMRSYVYIISKGRTAFGKRYVWWVKDNLDVNKMMSATKLLRGFHDFSSFADKRRDKNVSTTVNLKSAELYEFNDLIIMRIVASHFLWKMVRRIMGIMVEVGKGNIAPEDIKQILTSFSELPAKYTAPSSGLFLEWVAYEGDAQIHIELPPLPLFLCEHRNFLKYLDKKS